MKHTKEIDLIGTIWGDLTIIKKAKSTGRHCKYECKCICGNTHFVSYSHLKRGTKCCPECFSKNRGSHKMSYSHEYKCWARMIQRTTNENNPTSKYYILRGVTVCDSWRSFLNFFNDMGVAPSNKHSLDRYPNNDGNYEPGNVRWATMKEQSRNKRSNKIIEYKGVKKCLVEWCEEYGIEKRTLCSRFQTNWSVEKALTTPVKSRKK